MFFFFSSRRRHTRWTGDWSSDVCSSDLEYRYKNPEVLKYLTDRGVVAETIAKWRIGYAPGPPHYGWRELKEHMEEKGFRSEERRVGKEGRSRWATEY